MNLEQSWPVIIDLFAGAGGWDQGITDAGLPFHTIGFEIDKAACRTAESAGHARFVGDLTTFGPTSLASPVAGIIASPPCQTFSLSGQGNGRAALEQLTAHTHRCHDGWVAPTGELGDDVRSVLSLEPLRWVDALRPGWVAYEQVPPVLPLWDAHAEVLRAWGYRTATAVINAADYGTPTTRKRAVLVASRIGPATIPAPTHLPADSPTLFGDPWVSVRDALPHLPADKTWLYTGANTMKHSRDAAEIVAYRRPVDLPAPTVDRKARSAWKFAADGQPPYTAPQEPSADPAHKKAAVGLTMSDVGVLNGFPADYPWQGTTAEQALQAGNAVPPPVAAALVSSLTTPTAASGTEVAA